MLGVKETRVPAHVLPQEPPPQTFRETPLGRFSRRLFLGAASLKLAITLLSLFTATLALATFIESSYSGRIAQDLIYHTWWFSLLLCLLAVNILCAALKKFPWKRHQTGFLLTHAGLIVLVLGGLLTNLGGVEGQMSMIDSDNPEIQQAFRLPNRSDTLQLVNQHQIEIYRIPKEQATQDVKLLQEIEQVVNGGVEMGDSLRDRLAGNHWAISLSPGSFAWRSDEHLKPSLPWTVRLLSCLADPFPGLSRSLDASTKLVVENYYPHTERWPFGPSDGASDETTFPALQLKLTTPMAPRPFKRWVTSLPSWESDPSPIGFEMFTLFDVALLPEFLQPPATKNLGQAGQLVLAVGYPERKVCRIPLDEAKPGVAMPLAGSNLRFTLKKRGELVELLGQKPADPRENMPHYPAVLFELTGPGGTGTYVSCARMPHLTAFREGTDVEVVTTWYHHPDFRWGQQHKMGALQFLKAPDGRVFYRVYGKEGLKQEGKELNTTTGLVHELPWTPMQMQFEVLSWLPQAMRKEHIVPRDIRPGAEPAERYEPALRCTLHSNGETKEVWLRMSKAATQVIAGKEMYFLRYRMDTRRVDFSLTLKKARQLNDPGTNRAAAYESEVVLKADNDVSREATISMNHTLDHGGFKVYQTNYRPINDPQTGQMVLDTEGRLVSLSGFTLADDPGLFCKYLGSALLVLGIATMFWMRAYFFKPRRAA